MNTTERSALSRFAHPKGDGYGTKFPSSAETTRALVKRGFAVTGWLNLETGRFTVGESAGRSVRWAFATPEGRTALREAKRNPRAPAGMKITYRDGRNVNSYTTEPVVRVIKPASPFGATIYVTESGKRIEQGTIERPKRKRNPEGSEHPSMTWQRIEREASADLHRAVEGLKGAERKAAMRIARAEYDRITDAAWDRYQRAIGNRTNPGERQRAAALAFAMHRAPAEKRDLYASEFRKWHDLADSIDKAPKGNPYTWRQEESRKAVLRALQTRDPEDMKRARALQAQNEALAARRNPLEAPRWMTREQARTFLALPGAEARMMYLDRLRSFERRNPASYASPLAKRQDIRHHARGLGSFLREGRTGGHPYWALSRWESSDFTDRAAEAQLERAVGKRLMDRARAGDRGFWVGEIADAIEHKYGSP